MRKQKYFQLNSGYYNGADVRHRQFRKKEAKRKLGKEIYIVERRRKQAETQPHLFEKTFKNADFDSSTVFNTQKTAEMVLLLFFPKLLRNHNLISKTFLLLSFIYLLSPNLSRVNAEQAISHQKSQKSNKNRLANPIRDNVPNQFSELNFSFFKNESMVGVAMVPPVPPQSYKIEPGKNYFIQGTRYLPEKPDFEINRDGFELGLPDTVPETRDRYDVSIEILSDCIKIMKNINGLTYDAQEKRINQKLLLVTLEDLAHSQHKDRSYRDVLGGFYLLYDENFTKEDVEYAILCFQNAIVRHPFFKYQKGSLIAYLQLAHLYELGEFGCMQDMVLANHYFEGAIAAIKAEKEISSEVDKERAITLVIEFYWQSILMRLTSASIVDLLDSNQVNVLKGLQKYADISPFSRFYREKAVSIFEETQTLLEDQTKKDLQGYVFMLLKQAEILGSKQAIADLAWCYLTGFGVGQDLKQAQRQIALGIEEGVEFAFQLHNENRLLASQQHVKTILQAEGYEWLFFKRIHLEALRQSAPSIIFKENNESFTLNLKH